MPMQLRSKMGKLIKKISNLKKSNNKLIKLNKKFEDLIDTTTIEDVK